MYLSYPYVTSFETVSSHSQFINFFFANLARGNHSAWSSLFQIELSTTILGACLLPVSGDERLLSAILERLFYERF